MIRRTFGYSFSTVALTIAFALSTAAAAPPSDVIMSPDARGFASVPNLDVLSQHWRDSQMGQLAADEAMRPFIDDMKRQIEKKMDGARQKLGLTLDDLRAVATGEIGVGFIERKNEQAVVAVTVDVTGRRAEADALLAKVDAELIKRGSKRTNEQIGGLSVVTYQVPPQRDEGIEHEAAFFINQDLLCAVDSRAEAAEMIARFGGGGNNLAAVKPYQETMRQCAAEAGDLAPELRWYVDPFGYVRATRSLLQGEAAERKGRDVAKILLEQGFDAIQGVGGFVNLTVQNQFEILHRTAVYAPPAAGGYKLAMQMMKFPNAESLAPEPWIPRKLASYRTFHMDLQNAYAHFGPLFDAMAGYDNAFRDMIDGLETDPYGPQVKVQDEFIKHLGTRVTLVTDYEVPITTKSERFMFAIEAKDEKAIAAAIEKFMKADPNAHERQFAGKKVWEILPPESDVPELDLAGLEPIGGDEETGGDGPLGGKAMSTSAVCVTDGRLFVASHFEFLERVLSTPGGGEQLVDTGDYNEVDLALDQLIQGPVAVRCFVRTDEAYRPTYELLRQGKMPEAETLLGRVLNRLLTTPEDEDEGVLRKQKIDGRQLPHFEMVRRYFSPAGTAVRSTDTGWLVVGATLTKHSPQARAGAVQSADAVR